jgi:hypothetical protein
MFFRNKKPYISAPQTTINNPTITKPYTKPLPIENKSKNIFFKTSKILEILHPQSINFSIFYHKNKNRIFELPV